MSWRRVLEGKFRRAHKAPSKETVRKRVSGHGRPSGRTEAHSGSKESGNGQKKGGTSRSCGEEGGGRWHFVKLQAGFPRLKGGETPARLAFLLRNKGKEKKHLSLLNPPLLPFDLSISSFFYAQRAWNWKEPLVEAKRLPSRVKRIGCLSDEL